MPIFIHHGGTGSYKTSGAIMDMVIPAIKKGRTIVTNIRGMSTERCYQAFPEAPEGFELISIDTSTMEGREKIAKFFHWVPQGALLILDEATTCFPKSWRQSDLDALEYPGGENQAKLDNRPPRWLEAWEMHRHYGWDIVLTTPNIKGIRDDIRGACDLAYKHRNRGHIGLKGSYVEAAHYADNNGSSAANFIGEPLVKKIDKKVWALYDSTATDEIKDVQATRPIWKDPKLRFFVGIASIAVGYALYNAASGKISILSGPQVSEVAAPVLQDGTQVDSTPRPAPVSSASPVGYPSGPARSSAVVEPLKGLEVYIDGHLRLQSSGAPLIFFRLESKGHEPFVQTSNEIRDLGYKINFITPCFVRLEFEGQIKYAHCAPPLEKRKQKEEETTIALN